METSFLCSLKSLFLRKEKALVVKRLLNHMLICFNHSGLMVLDAGAYASVIFYAFD